MVAQVPPDPCPYHSPLVLPEGQNAPDVRISRPFRKHLHVVIHPEGNPTAVETSVELPPVVLGLGFSTSSLSPRERMPLESQDRPHVLQLVCQRVSGRHGMQWQ